MLIRREDKDIKGTATGYRPDIKVLDCTVRDGSLINSAHFADDFVRTVYETAAAAGIDYMEIGYKASHSIFSTDEFGPWKFSDEEDVRRIVGDNPTNLKLSVMADAGRTDLESILPRSESVIDLIRVACYIHQIPAALDIVEDAREKGYETSLNLMAVSAVQARDLEEALATIAQSKVDLLYLVDSFGSLYFQPVRDLALTYLNAMSESGKKVGIHAHNNMQLAFANTIESLALGVSYADATLNGMGRGAGNCPMEILLAFLKNPKFNIRPVLAAIQSTVLPLRKTMRWGYDVPYVITGILNEHPREAIAFLESEEQRDLVEFYDEIVD